MNRLLVEPDEPDADGAVTLRGRRARHLIDVLGAGPGRSLRAGIVDGPGGQAIVERVTETEVSVRCRFDEVAPAPSEDSLLLGLPRPKVLARVLEHATALGIGRIVVVRAWRSDKSHLGSRVLEPARIREHLIAGLEQGGRTRLPRVRCEPLFRPYVEDRLGDDMPAARIVTDVEAARDVTEFRIPKHAPVAIAIGPERGFKAFEIGLLAEQGFTPTRLGDGVLRVETAVAVAYGQLSLLRRLDRS